VRRGDIFVVDFWDGSWGDEEGGAAVALALVFALCGREVLGVGDYCRVLHSTIGLDE